MENKTLIKVFYPPERFEDLRKAVQKADLETKRSN